MVLLGVHGGINTAGHLGGLRREQLCPWLAAGWSSLKGEGSEYSFRKVWLKA